MEVRTASPTDPQEMLPNQPYFEWMVTTSRIAGELADFCRHREQLEDPNPDAVAESALALREVAFEIADYEEVDLLQLYAERLAAIEARSLGHTDESFDGKAQARAAETLRSLQEVQNEHNREYHPDIAGLSRHDQLVHYTFHVAKLSGALAEQAAELAPREDFLATRLPDMLIFGILISTAVNDRLAEEPIFPVFEEC